MRDASLRDEATHEANACRTNIEKCATFDATRLCNQPLLQSCYAETLRMYVAVYIIRKPVYEDAQVLDYVIPKDKMIVVSSSMAHMDKRNWNTGDLEEHPVERFWGERFLTYGSTASTRPPLSRDNSSFSSASSHSRAPLSTPIPTSKTKPLEPKFSLNGYSGAWIPFGGGIHQCPGRHWVKLQMLVSFAMINNAFDIEILDGIEKLGVDMAKYGLGALQPKEKVRFRIRKKAI